MVGQACHDALLYKTALHLTEHTWPLLTGLVHMTLISQRDAVAYRAGSYFQGHTVGV